MRDVDNKNEHKNDDKAVNSDENKIAVDEERVRVYKPELSIYDKKKHNALQEKLSYGALGFAVFITVAVLGLILGYVFIKGIPHISGEFLTSDYDPETKYILVGVRGLEGEGFDKLGIELEQKKVENRNAIVIKSISETSALKEASVKEARKDKNGETIVEDVPYKVKPGLAISKVGRSNIDKLGVEDAEKAIAKELSSSAQMLRIKVTSVGGGAMPMIMTTLYIILLSLAISAPIGIFAAIYLVEYAKPGKLVRIIRFGTESLAGIPSIIYGLFGMLFFVSWLNFGYSILAGALTLSIILLPVIIRQTEESLKAVPMSFREGSLGLGATKLQTIRKVVLPSAIPGIVVAIILSVGRIVGESAALLLTAGTVARIPSNFMESGATLTVKAYQMAQEKGDYDTACAIGTIIILIVLAINFSSKYLSNRLVKGKK